MSYLFFFSGQSWLMHQLTLLFVLFTPQVYCLLNYKFRWFHIKCLRLVHLRNFILKSNPSVNSLPFFLINMEWKWMCWPNSPHCHDRRLSILFRFSPAKCSWNPSNNDSYVCTKKHLLWPFHARDSLLKVYIFRSWQGPFMNCHVYAVPKANCQFSRTQSSTHFYETEFSLSWEKDFSLNLFISQTRDDGSSLMKLSQVTMQLWAEAEFLVYSVLTLPSKFDKLQSVLVSAQTHGKVYHFFYALLIS